MSALTEVHERRHAYLVRDNTTKPTSTGQTWRPRNPASQRLAPKPLGGWLFVILPAVISAQISGTSVSGAYLLAASQSASVRAGPRTPCIWYALPAPASPIDAACPSPRRRADEFIRVKGIGVSRH